MLNRGMTIPVMVRNIPRANLNLKVLDSIKSGGPKCTELRTFRWEVSI